MIFKNILSVLYLIIFLFGCGVKLPPDPLFATSPSNIENEVKRRKNESNNSDKNNDASQNKINDNH